MMIKFGKYPLEIESRENQPVIYDIIRKKWVVLTREEQVRQIWIHYLVSDKKISPSLIAVERGFKINDKQKRFDICIFGKSMQPEILIECKSPMIELKSPIYEQIARYNIELGAKIFLLSNGVQHFGFSIERDKLTILDSF